VVDQRQQVYDRLLEQVREIDAHTDPVVVVRVPPVCWRAGSAAGYGRRTSG